MKIVWKVFSLDRIFNSETGIDNLVSESDNFSISVMDFESEEEAIDAILMLERASTGDIETEFEIRKIYRVNL